MPSWGPVMLGAPDNAEVTPGRIQGLSCSVGLTDPPATITWYINGQPPVAYNVPEPVLQTYTNAPKPELRSVS